MLMSIKQSGQEEMVQYVHNFNDLQKLYPVKDNDILVSCFINYIFNKTAWDKVRLSVMLGDVISLEGEQELVLVRDRYIGNCFKGDNSVANPELPLLYMSIWSMSNAHSILLSMTTTMQRIALYIDFHNPRVWLLLSSILNVIRSGEYRWSNAWSNHICIFIDLKQVSKVLIIIQEQWTTLRLKRVIHESWTYDFSLDMIQRWANQEVLPYLSRNRLWLNRIV